MKTYWLQFLSALAVACSTGATATSAGDLTVFAAASLKEALDEVVRDFETKTGLDVTASYAGSSTLARQIEYGAPADIFISANETWMEQLQKTDRVLSDTRVDLLSNRLVLIGRSGTDTTASLQSRKSLSDALGDGKLAMALYDAVPAGIYGKAALEHLGLWDAVAGRIAQTDNVRAALALVTLGAAPLGIVYATDARAEPGVAVLATFPSDSHPTIIYPAAIIGDQPHENAQDLLDHLQSPVADDVFERYGFLRPVE